LEIVIADSGSQVIVLGIGVLNDSGVNELRTAADEALRLAPSSLIIDVTSVTASTRRIVSTMSDLRRAAEAAHVSLTVRVFRSMAEAVRSGGIRVDVVDPDTT